MRRMMGHTLVAAALVLTSLALGSDARADSSCKALFSDLRAFTAANSWAYVQVGVSTTKPGSDFGQPPVGMWGSGQMVAGTPLPKQVTPILTSIAGGIHQRSSANTFSTTSTLKISVFNTYGFTTLSSPLMGNRIMSNTTCSGNVMWGFDNAGQMNVLTFTKSMRAG